MIDIKKKIVTGKGSRIFCHSSSYEFILRSLSCLTKYRSALKKSFFVTSIPGSTEWLNLNSSIWGLKYLTYQSGKQRRQPTANLRNAAYPKLGPSKSQLEKLRPWKHEEKTMQAAKPRNSEQSQLQALSPTACKRHKTAPEGAWPFPTDCLLAPCIKGARSLAIAASRDVTSQTLTILQRWRSKEKP